MGRKVASVTEWRKVWWSVGVLGLILVPGLAAPRAQGGPPPILVVLNGAAPNPFGAYLPEILRAEGIKSFDVVDLGSLDAGDLASVALVILAETPLSTAQASLLTTFVAGGGRLIAMRPDTQLDGVLGISAVGGGTTDGYVLIDQADVGAGMQSVTLPFRGAARHVAAAGATSVATLYDTQSTSTGRPAVVRHNRTAAWTFDLARSTVVTRQGNPALAGVERDGLPPYRTTDIFFQQIDLQRVPVPHADVQMRLFSRMIGDLLADQLPLPRLWYFPDNARTMLVLTGDSHVNTISSYTSLLAAVEGVGARMTVFLARFLNLLGSPAATWEATGHDLSVHPVFAEDGASIPAGYQTVFDWFPLNVPAPVTPGPTVRHHTLEWSGWVGPVSVMNGFGIGMDFSYSSFGPTMHQPTQSSQAHGYITGSGLPMRFINESGQVLPVYQQSTSLADEQLVAGLHSEGLSVADALAVSRTLIDDSQAGGYSAITTQFHVDYYPLDQVKPWVDGTLAYAAGQQIPMWNAERWFGFVAARTATTITGVSWNTGAGQLTFSIAVPAGAPPQPVMVPPSFAGRVVTRVTIDGQTAAAAALTANGRAAYVVSVPPAGGGATRQMLVQYRRRLHLADGVDRRRVGGRRQRRLVSGEPDRVAVDDLRQRRRRVVLDLQRHRRRRLGFPGRAERRGHHSGRSDQPAGDGDRVRRPELRGRRDGRGLAGQRARRDDRRRRRGAHHPERRTTDGVRRCLLDRLCHADHDRRPRGARQRQRDARPHGGIGLDRGQRRAHAECGRQLRLYAESLVRRPRDVHLPRRHCRRHRQHRHGHHQRGAPHRRRGAAVPARVRNGRQRRDLQVAATGCRPRAHRLSARGRRRSRAALRCAADWRAANSQRDGALRILLRADEDLGHRRPQSRVHGDPDRMSASRCRRRPRRRCKPPPSATPCTSRGPTPSLAERRAA